LTGEEGHSPALRHNGHDGKVFGDAGGDGGGAPVARVAGHVLQAPHPSQQVPPGDVLLAVEVRGPAPRLREVRVRTLLGTHEEDAGDPPTRQDTTGDPGHSINQNCYPGGALGYDSPPLLLEIVTKLFAL
jgi:hypothetical protein